MRKSRTYSLVSAEVSFTLFLPAEIFCARVKAFVNLLQHDEEHKGTEIWTGHNL
jgi:hypothetical protein